MFQQNNRSNQSLSLQYIHKIIYLYLYELYNYTYDYK